MEIDRKQLLIGIIDSNSTRMEQILKRNNAESESQLPAHEFSEWQRLHDLNSVLRQELEQ